MTSPDTATVEFTTHIDKLPHLAGTHYIEVPPEIIEQLGGKFKIRLLCTVNSKLTFQCGLVGLGNGSAYISLKSERMKELKVKRGDKVRIALQKDDSKYGFEVPEELAELFNQDEEGLRRFEQLKPGMQRYMLQYIAGVKSTQLRVDRAITIIENLKQLIPGKETWPAMLGTK